MHAERVRQSVHRDDAIDQLLGRAELLLRDPTLSTPTAAALEALTALHRERALNRFQLRLTYPPGDDDSDKPRPTSRRTMRS